MALPKGYKVPETEKTNDGYLNKFEEGETKIRILSEIQTGYEWHIDSTGSNIGTRKLVKGDKPVRVRTFEEAVQDQDSEPFRHFWVMVVYNYQNSKVQILQVKQSSIQKQIEGYESDQDWGDSRQYDLVIKRTGLGFDDTEYQVIPKPAKPPIKEIEKQVQDTYINLDTWFDGGNPFKKEEKTNSEDVANDVAAALGAL